MPPAAPIGDREREILTAIVETFIATGEPVGSRTLARSSREGLSPATIRNVMSDLADAGFLDQPHTSAGRIPSAAATATTSNRSPATRGFRPRTRT